MEFRLTFREAERKDIEEVSVLGAKSYHDYEYFSIFFPDERVRYNFGVELQRTGCRTALRRDRIMLAECDGRIVAGAELIAPYDDEQSGFDFFRNGGLKVLLAGGFKESLRWLDMQEETGKICHDIKEPHWYLNSFAVDNDLKGQGIGTRMMQEYIIPFIAENGGGPLYLITNSEINSRFYLKNGFELFSYEEFTYNGKKMGNWAFRMDVKPIELKV